MEKGPKINASERMLRKVEIDENFKDEIELQLWMFGYTRVTGDLSFMTLDNDELDIRVRIYREVQKWHVVCKYDGKSVKVGMYTKKEKIVPAIIKQDTKIAEERVFRENQ